MLGFLNFGNETRDSADRMHPSAGPAFETETEATRPEPSIVNVVLTRTVLPAAAPDWRTHPSTAPCCLRRTDWIWLIVSCSGRSDPPAAASPPDPPFCSAPCPLRRFASNAFTSSVAGPGFEAGFSAAGEAAGSGAAGLDAAFGVFGDALPVLGAVRAPFAAFPLASAVAGAAVAGAGAGAGSGATAAGAGWEGFTGSGCTAAATGAGGVAGGAGAGGSYLPANHTTAATSTPSTPSPIAPFRIIARRR